MVAANDQSQRVLLRALSEQDIGYRRWMRPADIIRQSSLERHPRKRSSLGRLLTKLLRRNPNA
jgi:hypothetical protein